MNTSDPNSQTALEDEVMRRSAEDFRRGMNASAPVVDVDASESRPAQRKQPVRAKKIMLLGGLAIVSSGILIAVLSGGSNPPQAVSEAEIAAILPPELPTEPLAETPAVAPVAIAPSASDQAFLEAMAAAGAPAAPTDPVPAAEQPAPTVATDPAIAAVAATPPEPVPAAPQTPVPTEAAPPAAPAPITAAAPPDPAMQAEVDRLRGEVRRLQRAAAPATVQVVEVLEDGVVLRDAQGQSLIVPSGGQLRVTSGRVEAR